MLVLAPGAAQICSTRSCPELLLTQNTVLRSTAPGIARPFHLSGPLFVQERIWWKLEKTNTIASGVRTARCYAILHHIKKTRRESSSLTALRIYRPASDVTRYSAYTRRTFGNVGNANGIQLSRHFLRRLYRILKSKKILKYFLLILDIKSNINIANLEN